MDKQTSSLKKLITIDGPSASGKSSLSRSLAKKLSWKWLSTGVFYRGVAYLALSRKIQKEAQIAHLIDTEDWLVCLNEDKTCFIYKGVDITHEVYTESVDEWASTLAGFSLVRKALLPYQRDCFQKNRRQGLVAEGRDCGTVVFPFAGLKIYLTAADHIRAARRTSQRGSLPLEDVITLQKKRDEQDIHRVDSPLRQPEGAFVIDAGAYGFNEMVERAYKKSYKLFYLGRDNEQFDP
ncbi:MAG: (d)CMP kinase [Bdellovibrionales bacterium]|nr:(d)CMP kinase [Bdellovibrionales bacterium]